MSDLLRRLRWALVPLAAAAEAGSFLAVATGQA